MVCPGTYSIKSSMQKKYILSEYICFFISKSFPSKSKVEISITIFLVSNQKSSKVTKMDENSTKHQLELDFSQNKIY